MRSSPRRAAERRSRTQSASVPPVMISDLATTLQRPRSVRSPEWNGLRRPWASAADAFGRHSFRSAPGAACASRPGRLEFASFLRRTSSSSGSHWNAHRTASPEGWPLMHHRISLRRMVVARPSLLTDPPDGHQRVAFPFEPLGPSPPKQFGEMLLRLPFPITTSPDPVVNTQAPGGLIQEVDEASDMFLPGVQVHQIEPQPGAPSVAHGREPRPAGGGDAAREFFLEPVARRRIGLRRLEPRARDRELAVGQYREAALDEQPLQQPRQPDVPPDRLADGPPPVPRIAIQTVNPEERRMVGIPRRQASTEPSPGM